MQVSAISHPKPSHNHEGFTLVELLITIVVITFGCLAVLMMQSSSLRGNNIADNMTVATFLAESEIERIKSLTFKELTAEIADASTVVKRLDRLGTACTFASAAECPGFPYTLTIRYFPQFPTVYSHHAEVEVTWIDKTGPHGLLYTAVLTDLTF